MRIANWNPNAINKTLENVTTKRLLKAAKVVAAATKKNLAASIGSGETTGINRPVYRSGDYAGQYWTAREAGMLLSSVRVVQKKSKTGKLMWKRKNVRIYAGHKKAFYAEIYEFYKPFMRPALASTQDMVLQMIGENYSGEM